MTDSPTDPLVKVAADLRAIVELTGDLADQAVAKADDKDMPGGDAMAMLGPVANLEAWQNRYDTSERLWLEERGAEPHIEEPDFEPPLQTLLFWTETQRELRGMTLDRPTVDTEARFLGTLLPWLYENEPRFDALADDIHNAKRRLEAILRAGERQTPGIQCPRCRNAAMIRTEHDRSRPRGCGGHGHHSACPLWPQTLTMPAHCNCADRGGLIEEWRCPECHHELRNTDDHKDYDAAVFRDYVNNAPYLEMKYLHFQIPDVKPGTVKVWASRNKVKTRRNARGEMTYCVADIKSRLAQDSDVA